MSMHACLSLFRKGLTVLTLADLGLTLTNHPLAPPTPVLGVKV